MKSGARAFVVALFGFLSACGIYSPALVPPVIIVVNGALVPSGPPGSIVTINGAEFGDQQGAGLVTFTPAGIGIPRIGPITSPLNWTSGTIVTAVPDSAPVGLNVLTVTNGNALTSNTYAFTVTRAKFTPSGLTWSAGPGLPSAASGTGVAFAQVQNTNYVYAVGGAGAGGAPTKAVYYSTVGSNGTLSGWAATTPLPTPLAFAAVTAATQFNSSVASNGFLYVVGGAKDAAGTPVTTVYQAALSNDGTLGGWTTATNLPNALRSVGAMVWYGSLFVVGGAGAGNVPVATVYRSPVQVTGSVSLNQQVSLPSPRARFGFGASGLYLYVFGGDSASFAPNDSGVPSKRTATIFYGKLANNTHDVTLWTTASTSLPAPRSAETAVLQSNYALVLGGLYGATSSEAIYASLVPDGSLAVFTPSGATIGRTLFNHAATGYLGSDTTFHVLVVGGDDVGAPGTLHAETSRY